MDDLPVSQGGSKMDLDNVSKERGPDGRLTQAARDARRSLGRCFRCNQPGHLAISCPLATQVRAAQAQDPANVDQDQLKE